MSSDIIVAQLVTKEVQFARSQSGWIFREDKWEMVRDKYEISLN